MTNEDGSLWLTFNGEIYNAPTLRTELLKYGHTFKSHSDSEVLLHGFETWGMTELLNRLRGMFAFVIYDKNTRELWGARDRLGIKPLVYYRDTNVFAFASEVKGLPLPSLEFDPTCLLDYFTYSYLPHPRTAYHHTHKLLPGHVFHYRTTTDQLDIKRYWTLQSGTDRPSPNVASQTFGALLEESTNSHLLSDVPVGLFLSGGYDSSALLYHAQLTTAPPDCFTIGYTDSFRDETEPAKAVAQHYEATHRIRSVGKDVDFLAALRTLSANVDEPYAVSGLLSYHYVSELSAKTHKVVLAGDGGDEALAGYKWHQRARALWEPSLRERLRNLYHGVFTPKDLHRFYREQTTGTFGNLHPEHLLSPSLRRLRLREPFWYFQQHDRPDLPIVRRVQWLDVHTFLLDVCLQRADWASMHHSLEVRVPFVDHKLLEYTFSLHPDVLLQPGVKKPLLHRHLIGKLPEVITKMPKRGFSFAHTEVLTHSPAVLSMLNHSKAVAAGWIRRDIKPEALPANYRWHWLMLELFLEDHTP